MKALKAMAAICALLWAVILAWPVSPAEGSDARFRFVCDTPVVNYTEYKQLMRFGEVDVVRGEVQVHLVKAELGRHYLQVLGRLVRAE